jgi:multicomponent Na+:H+ antiporter subunit G
MAPADALSVLLLSVAGVFFTAGTLGVLRFPDTLSRLHAVTKVDNLGLGFAGAALLLQADSWATAGEIALIWLLALAASATAGYLLGAKAAADDRG